MSVLVTGPTGFIASRVVAHLLKRGRSVVGEERVDLARLVGTIAESGPEGIVHAAGISAPQLSGGAPAATVVADAAGTLDVLEAGRVAGFGGRIVLISSRAVYADEPRGADECASLQPRTADAATEVFGDPLGRASADSYGLDVVSLRVGEVYGPGRGLPRLVARVLDAARSRQPLRLGPDERRTHRLVHVEDVARAIVAALDAPALRRSVYDIVGERIQLEQLVAIVQDRVPDAEIEIEPELLAGSVEDDPVAATAAARELGYRPRWSLARGIDQLFSELEAEPKVLIDDQAPLPGGSGRSGPEGPFRDLSDGCRTRRLTSRSVKFRAEILLAGKTATGIEVPAEIVAGLDAGKKPPVRVTIAGHTYRSTVASRGERYLVPVSAENRERAGVAAGDEVDVELELDTEPRQVEVPADLAAALEGEAEAKRFFESLSFSQQRWFALSVEGAKKAETRQRRVEKALAMLREGRKP